ncbi:MAG: sucrose synthase [Phycisphaerae bacterium]|nr:sucrose synthase [Phycisphaerae bacterium]
MIEAIVDYCRQHREPAYMLFRHYLEQQKPFLLRSDLIEQFESLACEEYAQSLLGSPLEGMVYKAQEVAIEGPWLCFAIRSRIGCWDYVRFHAEAVSAELISVSEFLAFKEGLAGHRQDLDGWPLEIDLTPFNRGFPKLQESRSIGHGMEFLNRKLSSELFQDFEKGDRQLFEFLHVHQFQGRQLMLNRRVRDVRGLQAALRQAEAYLRKQPSGATWDDVADRMQEFGFEIGWGRTVDRMIDTLRLLSDVLEAPSASQIEQLLARIPMIFNIVILSPHGYFGQANVLGKPDTGGQVVYILDQARALEKEMHHRLQEQGIDIEPQILVVTRLIPEAGNTTCDQRVESIMGTRNARILRVPFRDASGEIVPHWISRFEIWPYLERFTLEVERDIQVELHGRPGLIIGNYSDGNLVASLLAKRLHVTQCNIAHALEKSKYLYSDLFWQENDAHYHFSCQFTADLIAMNAADFIVTSTFQEIAGTDDSVGQYESHKAFTMPGLFRVLNGIDVFDPKFNIVSPGADPDIYFSFREKARRLKGLRRGLRQMVFGNGNGSPHRGKYEDESKPMLFTMARLDRIKNIAGLVEWYARCPRLRGLANLLVVGGHLDPALSNDHEEREQIDRMHQLIDEHALEGQVRWIGFQSDRNFVGELYRFVADHRGAFVQPALFEAYGLTVIEAMASGLPTFATCYGGPLEIIEHDRCGFHIDPNQGAAAAELFADFFEKANDDPAEWQRISQGALDRIEARYTWKRYGQRMMTLARVYGFWKYVTNLEREETQRYLDMMYNLQFRPLARSMVKSS